MEDEEDVVSQGGIEKLNHPEDWKYSRVGTENRGVFGTPVRDEKKWGWREFHRRQQECGGRADVRGGLRLG